MRYTSEVIINLPIDCVLELFDNPDNMKKWQDGLQSFEPISGEPGQPGAKSRLRYDVNGRSFEMIETVIVRNLPDEFSGTYETNGMLNRIVNRFYEVDSETTRWVAENEVQFSGIMRIVGLIMGGSFRKNGRKMMENFKQFAESTQ